MTELKTLKDLKWNYLATQQTVSHEQLKQEAIKWIQRERKEGADDFHNNYLIQWIKHFFNTTDEDLK